MLISKRRSLLVVGAFVLLAGVISLPGCRPEGNPWPEGKGPKVLVTFPPLYSFAKSVAGDDAVVVCLLTREGPHGYQYNPRDANLLRAADLFLINGLGLDEHFAVPMANSCGNPKLRTVVLGDSVPKGQRLKMEEDEHPHEGHHHHGDSDPHVWLGIPEAIDMVRAIAKELSTSDPDHAAAYNRRAAACIERLEELLAEGKQQLAGKKVNLVPVHESLGYFARSFGVNLLPSIQVQPGAEPKDDRMRELAKLCVEKQVRIIAVEPQYPESTARTLLAVLKEKGVANPVLVTIDPLETAEPDELDAGWYERQMRVNLNNLLKALP